MFRIRLDNGHEALGYMGGRMKRYRIRVFPGDRVRIELSSYHLTRGRIVYRLSWPTGDAGDLPVPPVPPHRRPPPDRALRAFPKADVFAAGSQFRLIVRG